MGIDTKGFQPNPDITEQELAEMRIDVADRIIVARVGLLLRHPFFGNMATRLIVKNCDDWCPTAATDGRHLYYNTQFFNAMSNKEIEFVIAHEILHCVFDHITRREDRIPVLHNIACDYIVNNTLVRDKIGEMVKIVQCYQDFKYDGWMSEQVYDDLFKQAEERGQQYLDQLGELLDEHVDWEKDAQGNDKGKAKGKDGKGEGRPTYSKEELKKIRDEIEKYITTHKDFKTSLGHAVRVDKFADSSIDMYIRCFTVTDDWDEWLAVKERLAIEIKQIVEKNNASFAFPSQSIYVEKK